MQPLGDVASTGYALVSGGREYLVLEPIGNGEPFTVELAAGRYAVEWFTVNGRETIPADDVTADDRRGVEFAAPTVDAGPLVLYLRRTTD
jgi:hypothetical protein